ncbi:MAG: SpaH/EbpB family LPXTG-anchored major pilin [Suipraeoptans sp.]
MKKMKKIVSLLMMAVLTLSACLTVAAADPATVDTDKDVKLTIHKYRNTDDTLPESTGEALDPSDLADLEPLKNVEFHIFKTNININPSSAGALPTAADIEANPSLYGVNLSTPTYKVKTDANGEAVANIPAADQGIYYVVEYANPAVETPDGIPFIISLPTTNAEGDGWNYDVHAYPKNKLKDGPDIKKEIDESGVVNKGVNVGDDVTWRIVSNVPADLFYTNSNNEEITADKYEVTDILSKGLTYKSISFKTKAGTVESALALTANTHYTLTAAADASGGTKLVFNLTTAGMKLVHQVATTPPTDNPIFIIEIVTTVNSDALSVDTITNEADLAYTNSTGTDFKANTKDGKDPEDPDNPDPEKPTPEIHTGSTGLTKYATDTNAVLEGVKFAIADTEANAKAGNYIRKDAAGKIYFYGDTGYDSAEDYIVESNTGGVVIFEGLKYGADNVSGITATSTYYVVEVKAKAGYQLLKNPVAVIVSKNSDLDAKITSVKIYNNAKFVLPKTGGLGSILFTLAGVLLLLAAAVVIIRSRRKRV